MTAITDRHTATAGPRPARGGAVVRQIADRRRGEVLAELGDRTYRELAAEARRASAPRPVLGRLAAPGLHLIAEIKRRSPSAGDLAAAELDVAARARAYQAGGAA